MREWLTARRKATRSRVAATCVFLGLVAADGRTLTSAPPPPAATTAPMTRTVLDRYCIGCHNARRPSGNLVLEGIDLGADENGDVAEKVLRKLQTGLMPPAGMPRPDAQTYASLTAELKSVRDRAVAAAPNPGRPAVHRLNRLEYTNAIRDLLQLEVDGRSLLPADDAGFGFDNIADALTVSPGLMERYLNAAEKISRLAVGDVAIGRTETTYPVDPALLQEDRMDDELPAGTRGGIAIRRYFPLDGEYVFKIRLQAEPQFSTVRGLDKAEQVDLRIDGVRIKTFPMESRKPGRPSDMGGPRADAHLEGRLPVKAGTHVVAVTLLKSDWYMETIGPERLPTTSFGFTSGTQSDVAHGKQLMGVESVIIDGPLNGHRPLDTAARRQIFVCYPTSPTHETACARQVLQTLARRAFRRPVVDADIDRLMTYYNDGRARADFDAGIQHAVEAVLVDPEFLFRIERDPAGAAPGSVYRIRDLELASRLSFFLWSSIPDDELLDLASRGKLTETPAAVNQQIARMLRDPKSEALLKNFFGQWLWLRNVQTARPDAKEFPEFDDSLRAAFIRETELFLKSQVREDHSAVELLTANYTFLNEKLARHYGISGIYGSHFRRVTLPDDRRAGLFGQGAILTVTSYPNRTSPVQRGKWLLETILGAPPPAPPPDVPPFPEDTGNQPKSVRERMEQHRKNPVCAACHSQLDVLGFALENFNAVGQWRTMDANSVVDASGALPSGRKFGGPAEFRTALLEHREAFLTHLTEKLLTYAVGRGVEYSDMPAVRRILDQAGTSDYRWSSLIAGVVSSGPFRMRKSAS